MDEDDNRRPANDIDQGLVLADIKNWLEQLPEELRDKPYIGIGEVALSPRQVFAEVQAGTEYGQYFIRGFASLRQELNRE